MPLPCDGTTAAPLVQRLRRYCSTRSVGPRPSESVEGKEAEAGDSKARIADAGRHSPLALAAGRSQDGVLQQRLTGHGPRRRRAREVPDGPEPGSHTCADPQAVGPSVCTQGGGLSSAAAGQRVGSSHPQWGANPFVAEFGAPSCQRRTPRARASVVFLISCLCQSL